MEQRDFVVCFLLTHGRKAVLLQSQERPDASVSLQGITGQVNLGETPEECAVRVLQELTDLKDIERVHWLGTLCLGDDQVHMPMVPDSASPDRVTHYYAYEVDTSKIPGAKEGGAVLQPCYVESVIEESPESGKLAGQGELQYFLSRALRVLKSTAVSSTIVQQDAVCPSCGQVYKQGIFWQPRGNQNWSKDICPYCGTENGNSVVFRYQNTK